MRPTRILAAVAAAALLAAGCSDRGGSDSDAEAGGPTVQAAPPQGDFGDLKGVCGPGDPTASPAQGVTDKEIKVGVFTDVGFTKKQEFVDAAKVFTSWCNDAGGINGRKLVANQHDSKLVEVRQRMADACREDFALVGGGAAMDGTGTKDRLECLLPDFPGQIVQPENFGSDLQIHAQPGDARYSPFAGYYNWLLKEAYPASAGSIAVINGDTVPIKILGQQTNETVEAAGGTVVYSELYPVAGVSDWTPYAQTIKSKGVKGLIFNGQFTQLAKLEQTLTTMDYKLDWIDANSNAYGPDFLQLAGDRAIATQNNLADLNGYNPLETASTSPATQQVLDLFAKYAPGAQVNLPVLRAFSSWVLFAKSATSCGDNLTRKCAYDAAAKETAWTGGGIQAPIDLSKAERPVTCMNVVQSGPQGWKPADFKPNNGAYRCDIPTHKFTGSYPVPYTLADVGKSMADFK